MNYINDNEQKITMKYIKTNLKEEFIYLIILINLQENRNIIQK